VLLTLELAAIVLLFGAQVIAEYERIEWEPVERPPKEMVTRSEGLASPAPAAK
jgi:hypothetical protein